jgi:Tol biopolymer transport system component
MLTRHAPVFVFAPLLACSSGAQPNDAGGDVVAPVDASSDAPAESGFPPCDTSKPFGAPALIAELSTPANDLFPRLTPDELTVYLERYASSDAGTGGIGGSDLFVATRATVASPFGAPALVKGGINGSGNEFDPSVTGDDLTLFFASTRAGGAGGVDVWMASRADTSGTFTNVTNLAALNTGANEHTPYVLADGLTLYFTGTLGSALQRATRASSSAPFALDTSGVLDAVNTTGGEVSAVVTPDELTLYFARLGPGQLDMFVATRADKNAAFGAGASVNELNTQGNDTPAWISSDGCRLYLHSDVAGSYDLYVATKP